VPGAEVAKQGGDSVDTVAEALSDLLKREPVEEVGT